jgi:hypothetical protein
MLVFEAMTTSLVSQRPLHTWQADEGFSSILHGASFNNDRISFVTTQATPCNVLVFKPMTTILVSQRPLHASQADKDFSSIHHSASSNNNRFAFVASPATPGNITGIIRVVIHIFEVATIVIVVVETTLKGFADHAWVGLVMMGTFSDVLG